MLKQAKHKWRLYVAKTEKSSFFPGCCENMVADQIGQLDTTIGRSFASSEWRLNQPQGRRKHPGKM